MLAADPTSKQDDLVALVISVVYRQHAIPVAWHIVGAQARESWIDHFCRLLRLLAPAVPATVPVHVLCDQGLCSRELWAQIVALGWHPCLRYPPRVTFQPQGQTPTCTGAHADRGDRAGLWVGTGRAFRDEPLDGTLIVLQAYGQTQPWVLLTDTPVAQTEPTLYACRNWIEQGFRGLKTVGWKWHKTRRRDPIRVGRHWLVLAIATLLAVAYGTRREEAEARHLPPGRLRRPPGRVDCGPPDRAAPASPQPLATGRGAAAPLAAARVSVGLRVAAAYARSRLPHAPAPAGPRRHLNLPAPSARDPHRTPPSLSPHPGRRGPQHHAAARPAILPLWSLTALTLPLTVAPAAFGPCHTRGGPTDPDASTDSHPGNTLVKEGPRPAASGPRRHLNLPALPARDLHRSPPSLSPHTRPPRSSASRGRQTGNSTPLEQARPHTAADSRSRHAWPSHTRGRPTAPAASTDSRSENTLVKGVTPILGNANPACMAVWLRAGTVPGSDLDLSPVQPPIDTVSMGGLPMSWYFPIYVFMV